jgi:hypothetical protein
MKYVHKECLKTWRKQNQNNFEKCISCNTEYKQSKTETSFFIKIIIIILSILLFCIILYICNLLSEFLPVMQRFVELIEKQIGFTNRRLYFQEIKNGNPNH